MKTGKSLVELAQEIERQKAAKRDFVADTRKLCAVVGDDNRVAVEIADVGRFPIAETAHRQIGERLGIHAKYYDRMAAEAPGLLATNINHWFANTPEARMVRTLDGKARAFLSDKFRPLDHADLAEAVLPPLMALGVEVLSCEITERRLYIKAVDARITRDVPSGRKMGDGSHVFFDTCSPAIIISNSEIGAGATSIEAGVWTKLCTNMAIASSRSMKRYHVGGKAELAEGFAELLSDKTKRMTDAATWAQIADVVKAAFEAARFDALISDVKGMAEQVITGDPSKVVELAAARLNISEAEKPSILRHLIQGGDLTRYGLFNAVTRSAQDLDDYDRATDFERLGGKIIELPKSDWQEIAQAA